MAVTARNTQIVGQSLTLTCSVTTMNAITGGMVDIIWRRDDIEVANASIAPSSTVGSVEYTDTYDTPVLSTNDNGVMYQCEVMNSRPLASDNITLAVVGELQ